VRGPLGAPSFQADRKSSIKRLLGVASIFVYPPAALVGLGHIGETGNPCIRMIDSDARQAEEPGIVDEVSTDVGEALESLGRGIQGLFRD
jgi:hypothetical protein